MLTLLDLVAGLLEAYGQPWAEHVRSLQALRASDPTEFACRIVSGTYWAPNMGTLIDVGLVDEERPQPAQEIASGLAFYSALLEIHSLLTAEGLDLPPSEPTQTLLRANQEAAGLIPPQPRPWLERR